MIFSRHQAKHQHYQDFCPPFLFPLSDLYHISSSSMPILDICPRICGPKCSVYYMVVSAWGIIMLGLMGVFFKVRSPSLFEDVDVSMSDWRKANLTLDYVKEKYDDNAINCWLAAGLYVIVFIVSFIQQRKNANASYEQS